MTNNEANPALNPPGLVACLQAGFDTIANHITLLVFPVILDLLLWFGPRLSLKTLVQQFSARMFSIPGLDSPEMVDMVSISREIWNQAAQHLNLFSSLRTYPVGVSSLMVASLPLESPLGQPLRWELFSFANVAAGWLLFTLLGLLAGTLYFSLVAQAVQDRRVNWWLAIQRWPRNSLQVLLLSLFFLAILVTITIPCFCMVMALSLGGLALSQVGLFVYFGVVLWILFPLIFSPLAIFSNQLAVWPSVRLSLRMMRWTMPRSTLFFMIALLIGQGLDMLWRVPDETSWLALVGVFGHAFISTSLLAGVFTYFQRTQDWLKQIATLPQPAGWAA